MKAPRPQGSPARALFGPLRTLNVRGSGLTGRESAARVEAWLRSKQVELTGDVLIITGRGAGSVEGVPVIKDATRKALNRLRRLGVIESFGEDTPGSFIVALAPLRSLLEAPARRRTPAGTASTHPATIEGLRPGTQERLRYLAEQAIAALGVRTPTAGQVAAEMARQFSIIARTAPSGIDQDRWVDAAVSKALLEYSDASR